MRTRMAACAALAASMLGGETSAQQPPEIGIAPVMLTQSSYEFDTAEQHRIRVVVVVKGLNHPFSVALLPSGDALVTERSRALRLVRNATSANGAAATLDPQPIAGVPKLDPVYRSGGLHEVALHPDFEKNRLVYLTFNKPGRPPPPDAKPPVFRESIVSLIRGRLEGHALMDVQEIFTAESGSTSVGSRLAFGKDGVLYMTTGGPFGDTAERLDNVYGKVLRLRDDGTVPPDNPFVGKPGVRPEIYSYGHRDQLGLTVHPVTGVVLSAEHGPNGGDEVNLIVPGNYGWPKFSYGRNYDGTPHAATPVGDGIEQPLIVWLPSIGPSGLTFYTGDRFPAWKGNLFIGSVRRGEIPRTGSLERVVLNDRLEELRREALLTELHQRIRDVRQGPDGLLYVLTDEDDGALLRIEPSP